jgi:hypothetical protein
VSYIGDLLGTRPVSEQNRRGQRVAVARTIFYRRRKGTPLVLEALIRDIGDFDGAVVEAFRRLARSRHRLDRPPVGLEGPITLTPPGGTANLRAARISDIVDGPFDDLAHTPDVRQLRGPYGRYNIPKINFHLFTVAAYEIRSATPLVLGNNRFTFDPSGRDVPLFQPRQRPEEDGPWRPWSEWELPAPLTCRRFNAASFEIARAELPTDLVSELASLAGYRYRTERVFRTHLAERLTPLQLAANLAALLEGSLTEDSPKRHLWPAAVAVAIADNAGAAPVDRHAVTAGDLERWGVGTTFNDDVRLVVDPARGRFLVRGAISGQGHAFAQRYHFGLADSVGAGPYDRALDLSDDDEITGIVTSGPTNVDGFFTDPGPVTGVVLPASGVHRIESSKTFEPNLGGGQAWAGLDDLMLEASNGQRPYIRFTPPAADPTIAIQAAAGGDPKELVLDGLWLGIVPPDLASESLPAPDVACTPLGARLVIDGSFRRVVLRHCTIDPGGERARTDSTVGMPIPSVTLEIHGQVDELVIDHCITGPIVEATSSGDPCSARDIVICDSIVQSIEPAAPALSSRIAKLTLLRSTVFGEVRVNRLYASEALIQGLVRVTDNQSGCFRFSAADAHPDRRLPPQFESHLVEPRVPNHFFTSRRFGDPGYAKLSPTAPRVIETGGENRSEIGAFNSSLRPIRREDLEGKVYEYLPFGLIAQFIEET